MDEELKVIIDKVCGNSFPRNMVAVCDELNIRVRETDEFKENVSGLIYKENGKYYIYINSNHSVTRQNFTIAHELSHYFMHKDKLENGNEIVSYLKSQFREVPALARCEAARSDSEYIKMEREANQMAADILMPESEFLAKCAECDRIENVAKYFGVSVPAATVRANILGGWLYL